MGSRAYEPFLVLKEPTTTKGLCFYETRSNESFSSDDTSTAQNDSLEAAREAVRTATNRQPEKSPKRQLGSTYESSQMTSGAAREAGRMTKKAATKVNRMTA